MLRKYLPLVDRVHSRAELADLQGQMAAELSVLHTYVYGGDRRTDPRDVSGATLGARLSRDERSGGWRVDHVFRADPDLPGERSPLARYGVEVRAGDVITAVNGVATLSVPHPHALLRNQAGKLVRLSVRPAAGGTPRDVMVEPISIGDDFDLRYDEWEYTRRLAADSLSHGTVGYVHLRAMGSGDAADWYREFYPQFNRQGLIVDVRHNGGGNIESWILEKLLRKAWMYWQPRVGDPYWNMQYAFRGHMVVLVDERTASDGEAFADGFRRLGMGQVIGTRTWGGEVWLSSSNRLNDRGIVTAAEFGVYGPDGKWLIEGWGVEPDQVVDNLPHATFRGEDAQLAAAVRHLQQLIASDPRPVPPHPAYPDKAAPDNRMRAENGGR
jgi:tricorn protease